MFATEWSVATVKSKKNYNVTMNNTEIMDLNLSDATFCVLDFETTGISAKKSRVIEIGIVKICKLKIIDNFRTFINPAREIPFEITALTGIMTYNISEAPYFIDIIGNLSKFIKNSILVAHNMPFDHSFLRNEFLLADKPIPNNPTLCTLKLARKLYPQLPSKSLGNLTRHFHISQRNVHRALGDAMSTAKLLLKMIRKLQDEHQIETVKELLRFQDSSGRKFRITKKSLIQDLSVLPDYPGVYFFKNKKDEIIYVGKAKSIRKRVQNYFTNTASRKAKKIVGKASKIRFEITNSELTALLTEAALIKKFNPTFNSQLKEYSQQHFIKVKLNHKAPNISSTQKLNFDGNDYFGPYNNRETVKTLIEIVNRSFKLRECTEKEFAKKKTCYLYDIHRCLAPCVDETNPNQDYENELKKAFDFLQGNSQPAINSLLKKMKQYSNQQKYEAAAEIRNSVNLILNQLTRASILSEPINKANVLLVITEGNRKDYMLFLQGHVFIKDFSPDKNNSFDEALNNYFDNTIKLIENINKRDLEQMKIALSWLVKNRNKVKIYYLKNYKNKRELEYEMNF